MGDLSRDWVDYESEIEDLLEELRGESSELEDISISSSVYEPVLVGLKDKTLETRLEKAFYPHNDTEIVVRDVDGTSSLIIPVEDLQFLAFVNSPLQMGILSNNDLVEVIETCSGDPFTINVPSGQDFPAGFFGINTDPADRYKYIFFIFNNIRIRYQKRPIGEIIIEKGLLSEDVLQNVLSKQNQLRRLRLGEIIVKRTNLLPDNVENILQQALQEESANNTHQSGEILIDAGLVSYKEVEQSLVIQKKLRTLKMGKLLVEMGYIDDYQRYELLAEKYRMRFVNLEEISLAEEVLHSISYELVQKLMIIPIHFQGERLILATPFPEKAELNDILREKLSCPFELVVSPFHQINDIMISYFGREKIVPRESLEDL